MNRYIPVMRHCPCGLEFWKRYSLDGVDADIDRARKVVDEAFADHARRCPTLRRDADERELRKLREAQEARARAPWWRRLWWRTA